jgi:hypothetical protein
MLANARLIAAAPELLEACKMAVDPDRVGEEYLDEAAWAIAKVEGQ